MDKILYAETVVAGSGGVTANRCVKYDGTQASVQGEKVLGIAEYNESQGRPVSVACIGTKIAEAGAAFSRGDELVADANGRLIANPESGGEHVVADALADAATAGDLAEVFLRR